MLSVFFFFKQKTAYELRISDWSSDVCSSDLTIRLGYDPVIAATERPWQGAKSVYGPIATWIQWFSSWVGGDSMQLTVWMLQLSVAISLIRAEERRVGKECVRQCRSRWGRYH